MTPFNRSSNFQAVYDQRQHDPAYYQPQVYRNAVLLDLTRPFHQKLLDEAKRFLAADQSDMAVVVSQAACEQCTEWAINGLLAGRDDRALGDLFLEWFRDRDIVGSTRVRGVYEALSSDSPTQQPFWEPLTQHQKRRNKLVHAGEHCSPQQAEESVAAVENYISHVDGVLAALQATAQTPVGT